MSTSNYIICVSFNKLFSKRSHSFPLSFVWFETQHACGWIAVAALRAVRPDYDIIPFLSHNTHHLLDFIGSCAEVIKGFNNIWNCLFFVPLKALQQNRRHNHWLIWQYHWPGLFLCFVFGFCPILAKKKKKGNWNASKMGYVIIIFPTLVFFTL